MKIDPNLAAVHPGAALGLMLIKNAGGGDDRALDPAAEDLISRLQTRWAGLSRSELKNSYPLDIYAAYYKKFGQNYMVQHQLESVLSGKKNLKAPFALQRAMFMAEMETLMLTAGHDLKSLSEPLTFLAPEDEMDYISISGKEVKTTPLDLTVTDSQGVIGCIIKGPDQRTKMTPETEEALFVVYAPPGIVPADILHHLDRIETYVKTAAGGAVTEYKRVLSVEDHAS